ncbi:hypothetical protein [Chryseobacterium sp. MMS23-Vi53]|uniref:hypothetical protein n=1 Tax=Chryseobacterium sp. MMS23-Vi53 TaxID=3386644 RepID=UPI0039E855FA
MKNKITITLALTVANIAYAQVGVNTSAPKATFDITAKSDKGTSTNPEGLLVPRVDRQKAQSMTGVETSTMIYVNNVSTGTLAGTAVNIDKVGYYYFNGTAWVKPDTDNNIYNSNGALTGNRTVTQGANTLAFTGTSANAFSVDGATFSVNAANDRVGIGTAAPNIKLHVEGSQYLNAARTHSTTRNALDINIGQDSFAYGNRTDNYGINIRTASSVFGGNIARINFGDTNTTTNNGTRYLSFSVGRTPNELIYLTDGNGGRVGIGTVTPQNTLDVRGSFRLVNGSEGANKILTSDANGVATWQTPAANTDTSIYAGNGTLSGNREVTQGNNTLAFTSTATTGTNHFSVDGSTLSVDAATNRVGIGTTTPQNLLDLGTGHGKKLSLWNNSTTGDDFYGLGTSMNVLQLFAGATAAGDPLITLNKNGRVGIGTTAPATNFHTIGTRRFENATAGSVAVGSVLTATDTNGTAEWQTPKTQVISGAMGPGYDFPFGGSTDFRYTGANITLPPGKWLVTVSQWVKPQGGNLSADDFVFVRSTFSDQNLTTVGQVGVQSTDVNVRPTLISFLVTGPFASGTLRGDVKTGSIIINNTSTGNKTYRYIVGSSSANRNAAGITLNALGGSWSENSIVATAIN